MAHANTEELIKFWYKDLPLVITSHNIGWQVSLSNGQTFQEFKYPFQELKGRLSPWRRLVEEYLPLTKDRITSLGLYHTDGRTWNLHSRSKNPKFSIFSSVEPPIDFEVFRAAAGDVPDGNAEITMEMISDLCTVAEAVYSEGSLQLWVDEKKPHNCWTLFLPSPKQ